MVTSQILKIADSWKTLKSDHFAIFGQFKIDSQVTGYFTGQVTVILLSSGKTSDCEKPFKPSNLP